MRNLLHLSYTVLFGHVDQSCSWLVSRGSLTLVSYIPALSQTMFFTSITPACVGVIPGEWRDHVFVCVWLDSDAIEN